jgi:hypothetical protein
MGFGTFFDYWRNQVRVYQGYWITYGGTKAFIKSPYLHVSLVFGVLGAIFVDTASTRVSDVALGIIPNLLGVTLGAMAIVLAFSSAALFTHLADHGRPDSFFMKLMANLVHFIVVQVIALLSAIITKVCGFKWFEYLILPMLIYAVIATLAAAIQLFQAAVVYNGSAAGDCDTSG